MDLNFKAIFNSNENWKKYMGLVKLLFHDIDL